MSSIWMGIAPGPTATRVLAMHGPSKTLLKARLRRDPSHPRAMATLLEAIALWQGMPVRAALAADDEPTSSDSSLFRDPFDRARSALCTRLTGCPRRARAQAAGDCGHGSLS